MTAHAIQARPGASLRGRPLSGARASVSARWRLRSSTPRACGRLASPRAADARRALGIGPGTAAGPDRDIAADFQGLGARAPSFDSMAAFGSSHWPGIGRARSESFPIAPRAVSRRFFRRLGRTPLVGRDFTRATICARRQRAARRPQPRVLGDAIWRRGRCGRRRAVHRQRGVSDRRRDAQRLCISRRARRVDFGGAALGDVFARSQTSVTEQRALGVLEAVGRLRPGSDASAGTERAQCDRARDRPAIRSVARAIRRRP